MTIDSNVDLIKKYLVPQILIQDILYAGVWKKDFTNSINRLLKNPKIKATDTEIIKDNLTIDLTGKSSWNITLNEALSKYEKIINQWTPEKELEVFWLKGLNISTIDSQELLNQIYKKHNIELIKEVFNAKSITHNEEILIKLAIKKQLNKEDFHQLEIKNLDFYVKKAANFPLFRKLVKIGDNYESSLIWEYYLEFHKGNQLFLNKVKESFLKEKRAYEFEESKLDFFSKNKYTRTLKINPNMLLNSNNKIQANTLDNFVVGLNNWLHELGKTIEENVEMSINYEKSGHRIISIIFDKKESINEFDIVIEKFERNFKEIIGSMSIEKEKTPGMYKNELMILGNYYHLNDKFKEKLKTKANKI